MKFLDSYAIRVGGGVIATVCRIKRFIQMMALIMLFVASVTLLLYQNAYAMRVIEVSVLDEFSPSSSMAFVSAILRF